MITKKLLLCFVVMVYFYLLFASSSCGIWIGLWKACAICYRNREYKRHNPFPSDAWFSWILMVKLCIFFSFLFFFCSLIVVNHSIIFLPILLLISLSKFNLNHLLCFTLMCMKTSNYIGRLPKTIKKKNEKKKEGLMELAPVGWDQCLDYLLVNVA